MSKIIQVNSDVLLDTGNSFISYADQINQTEQAVISAMAALRGTAWDSEGKTILFELFDSLLGKIKGANGRDVKDIGVKLKNAYRDYQTIYNQIDRLGPN